MSRRPFAPFANIPFGFDPTEEVVVQRAAEAGLFDEVLRKYHEAIFLDPMGFDERTKDVGAEAGPIISRLLDREVSPSTAVCAFFDVMQGSPIFNELKVDFSSKRIKEILSASFKKIYAAKAEGAQLDALARVYGVDREDLETDASLRNRIEDGLKKL